MEYFAVAASADPISSASSYLFTQGVLGVAVVAMALVIRYIFKYYTQKLDDKDAEIKALNVALLQNSQTHAVDYREMAKSDQAVLSSNSQAISLIAGKIETVKGNNV